VLNSYLPCRLRVWLLIGIGIAASEYGFAQEPAAARFRDQTTTELPYRGGKVVITSQFQQTTKTHHQATGHVTITYQDIRITCDDAEYDEATHKGSTSGKTQFTQGQQSLTCSRAEFDVSNETATFYDAVGHTDEGFLIQGKKVLKTGHDTYELESGLLTSCQEKVPKWRFDVGDAKIHVDQTARLSRVLFKVKGVPVLYLPYLVVPMENKKRSAGFLPFHTGTSTSKGRQFSLGYYQPLGRSSDIELNGDYYSLRGFGFGGLFRTRPNDETSLDIEAYGVNDRLHQGGAVLQANGSAQFENGFRAVASVNMSTNFQFRQTFSESFQAATIPEEQALLFATRNSDSFSTDISVERREVFFPNGSLVTRKSPSIEFYSLGKSLGRTPLIFTLRAAAEGLSRYDSVIETPRIVQRLDFFPSLSVRVPSLAGFSIVPSVGFRETYYSARLSDDSQPVVLNTPLSRQYTDVEVSLRTPELEGDFHSGWLGDFKHIVEPMLTYRRIYGITDLNETIRFDDEDAIADTNEIEYGIVNRIMRKREIRPGMFENYEVLSFKVAQKHYFDPTFGGAFLPGEDNQFYPLDTLSGFSATGIERSSSPVNISLRVMPQPGISYDVRADYDPKSGRLRDTSLWATWHRDKLSLASTFVKADALEPNAFSADHVQAQVGYGSLSRGFSAGVTVSYNIQTHTLLNSNSRLNYMWNCCGISLNFQQYDLNSRTESRFTFSFSLKGIGNFGNLKGPERLF
jgi:LPS-assembly protein